MKFELKKFTDEDYGNQTSWVLTSDKGGKIDTTDFLDVVVAFAKMAGRTHSDVAGLLGLKSIEKWH